MEITFQESMNLLAIIGGIVGTSTGLISIWREIQRNRTKVEVQTTIELLPLTEKRQYNFKVVTVHNLGERKIKVASVYLCTKNGKDGKAGTISLRPQINELPKILEPQESANFFIVDKLQLDEIKKMDLHYAGCLINYRKEFISKKEYEPELEIHYSLTEELNQWCDAISKQIKSSL